MSEIILIYPTIPKRREVDRESMNFTIPMGVLCIGSFLNHHGFKVKLIDARLDADLYGTLLEEIGDAIYVGISAMSSQIKPTLQITEFIKKHRPDLPVVLGGAHPTFFPKETCADPLIDFVVFGEGELTMLELAEKLKAGETDFASIDGLAYKENGAVNVNPGRGAMNLNSVPFPSLELVEVDAYIMKNIHGQRMRTLELNSSRGCPHRCAYCINTVIHKKMWRAKDPARVLDELESYINTYDVEHIHFLDENFFVNRQRVEAILDGIIERNLGVSWQTNVRADYFKPDYLAGDIIKKVKKSGCIQLNFGAESGSDEMLKRIKKDSRVEQLITAVKTCTKNNIIPNCSFMIGMPGEKREDMEKTIKIIKEIKDINPNAMIIGPQIFRPYPGCELYDECVKTGFVSPTSLSEWADMDPYLSTGYISLDELAWIEDKEFVEAVSLYTPFATHHRIFGNPLSVAGFILISKLRFKLNFWRFPFEYKIFNFLRNILKGSST